MYYANYPTDIELLKIFPEAKEIVPMKIKEWLVVKEKSYVEEIQPFVKKIAVIKDPFSKWFWLEVIDILDCRFNEARKQLKRLKRLQLLLSNKQYKQKTYDLERSKEIAKQTPITSIYSFEKLRRNGKRQYALCPFHGEKTASFMIDENNKFHCFGCGVHGDAISFMQLLKDCDFKTAVAQLAGG